MSDIVERLRHRYPELEIDTDRKSVGWEAAEEIERLRAALKFYADWEGSKMFFDEGETARRALDSPASTEAG